MKKEATKKEKPLSNRTVYILLGIVCAITFIIRVVWTYHLVFINFVSFLETDAYNRMTYARLMDIMPFGNSIVYMVQHNLLFSWIISIFGRGFPVEIVGAWIPPIMAVGTVIIVYLIGKELFNPIVGLLSALFVAIIPSEFLHRSLVGFTDHHVLEVLLLCLSILFLIKSIKAGRLFNKYTFLAGLVMFLYYLNWQSGLYMMGLILVCTAIGLGVYFRFLRNNSERQSTKYMLLAISLPLAISLILYLPVGGYRQLMFLIPQSLYAPLASQTTKEIMDNILSDPGKRTISELMPLLYPQGVFSLSVVITNLHLFILTFLAGIFFIWKLRHDKMAMVLFVWTLIMLVLSLNNRRFLYYFTVNIGIVSALCLYELAKRVKGNRAFNIAIFLMPLLIFSLPLAKFMVSAPGYQMPQDWHSALVVLREQPGYGMVTTWGDYGHWIRYVSDKYPNNLPGPGGTLTADLLLSTDNAKADEFADKLDTKYIIVDQNMIIRTYYALLIFSGYDSAHYPDKAATLLTRLYNKANVPAEYVLIYENSTVKIYRRP